MAALKYDYRPNVRFAAAWADDAAAVALPDDSVDGRPAKVFRLGAETVYLDAKTGLPLLVLEVRTQGVIDIWDRFGWPADLDEGKFRPAVPAGYKADGFTPPPWYAK